MTWNYRVVRLQDQFAIHEAFYRADGSVDGITLTPVFPRAETLEALAEELDRYRLALDAPVLTENEICRTLDATVDPPAALLSYERNRRCLWPVILAALFINRCADSAEHPASPQGRSSPKSSIVAKDGVDRVPIKPSDRSREVAPGVFVEVLSLPDREATQIENLPSVLVVETMYDDAGIEVGKSVPSTNWSLLREESRVWLAGMRSGEGRRIWRCGAESESHCKVEDVFIYDDSQLRQAK